ncbi:TPA: hypothetical protein ACIG2F_004481 [Salmonella enterica subsp. enterica serovar Typhimurium]|nr:hypothetical protein [Salmonella enterica]
MNSSSGHEKTSKAGIIHQFNQLEALPAIAGGMLIINPLHEINNGTHLQTGVHYRKRLNLAISLNLNEKTRWHVTGNRPHDVRDHLTP